MLRDFDLPLTRLMGWISLLGILFLSACEAPVSSDPSAAVVVGQVQAILKVQASAFNPRAKDKVEGAYRLNAKLKVPSDLAPQNKWVMFEGPVLENELIAYRVYLDSRHRYDIYGKRVYDLVMDTVGWQYHDIMDWGSDILKVGNSLGMGSPALWYNDSLYTLSFAGNKLVHLTAESDTFAQYSFDFQQFSIGPHQFNLVQTWSLAKGSPWSEVCMFVKGQNLPEDISFATGLVNHGMTLDSIRVDGNLKAYTWGKQSFHKEEMGMALDFAGNEQVFSVQDPYSHAFVIRNDGGKTCYRFMAAWSRDVQGITNEEGFRAFLSGE
ncbi:MAG: DUF4861 family protein [Bacteroidota bacterium]